MCNFTGWSEWFKHLILRTSIIWSFFTLVYMMDHEVVHTVSRLARKRRLFVNIIPNHKHAGVSHVTVYCIPVAGSYSTPSNPGGGNMLDRLPSPVFTTPCCTGKSSQKSGPGWLQRNVYVLVLHSGASGPEPKASKSGAIAI
jgi:hypothetical protein